MPRVVDAAAVEAVFAQDGPLAQLLTGYAPRRAQIDMALRVAQILHTPRGRLVVEAGTGTGKSLAYLVPALLSEGRVVVATGTRALQDQLVDKDAPLAVAAVMALRGESGTPTQTVMRMKGRNNYLCKLRWDRFDRQQHFGFTDDVLVQIGRFAKETKTGDKAELKGLPDSFPLWNEIDANKDSCLGQACPVYNECFVVEMRRQAEKASVVVVNHHLLCADQRLRLDAAGFDDGDFARVLPTTDALIVDEAHALADVATDYFGLATGSEVIARLSGDVRRNADACMGDDRAALMDRVVDVDAAAAALFASIGGAVKQRSERALYRPSDENSELALATNGALAQLADALDHARQRLLDDGVDIVMQKAALDALYRRSERTRAELSYLTGPAAADDRFVLFVDHGPRGTHITAAPIDVSSPLSGTLFAGETPVILTSATLAVGDDVGPFLFTVGLAGRPAPEPEDSAEDEAVVDDVVVSAIFPSPFDHRAKAALYCPVDMVEPNDPRYLKLFDDEVVFLLALSKGGALVLFTSHRAMEEAHARLKPALQELGIPLLKQGERPKAVLLDELRTQGHSALFATASFWEGVDVRGAALRLVIIDRLPFRVPSDPLVRARGEHARSLGKDPFNDVAVQEAALALKQGAGRLLRTVDDAGVVAVLDGRLRRRSYGKVFLNALPPMTRVGVRKALAQFWIRFVEPALGLSPTTTTTTMISPSAEGVPP
ncbi:MAG: ATP-dependent DNA helicase [Deltaproteobacteria bacterium]|nr:ATP-dependent DNA helicase [Deltaproteobacteria bacterium]